MVPLDAAAFAAAEAAAIGDSTDVVADVPAGPLASSPEPPAVPDAAAAAAAMYG